MSSRETGEWASLLRLLPAHWKKAARSTGAFQRARHVASPGDLLRLLLAHAIHDGGLRSSAHDAVDAELPPLSDVALYRRLQRSVPWLQWLCERLSRELRLTLRRPGEVRPRALDGSTVQAPRSQGTEWRLHYTLDLATLDCDWHQLTDAHTSEALERVPVAPGDLLIADRNFSRLKGIRRVRQAEGHVLVRLKWQHFPMHDVAGREVRALVRTRSLRVDQPGDWDVALGEEEPRLTARLVALKLPAPLALRARQRIERAARKKQKIPDPRSLEAAQYVMLLTTLARESYDAKAVLEMYRWRWQIELAFKRLKQLLRLGKLPHRDPLAAQGWILAKMVAALLLEKLYRQARSVSPWGYSFVVAASEPLALVSPSPQDAAPGGLPGAVRRATGRTRNARSGRAA